MLPSKSVPTTGRGSGKCKRGVDNTDSNVVVQVGEDIQVNVHGSNTPQEKRGKKEVYSF